MSYRIIILILLSFLVLACEDDFGEQSVDPGSFQPGAGVFIVNEGNFGQGNGSISFYSYDDTSIVHDVFRTVNERPLGDLPVAMRILGERFFISVNHSGRLESGNASSLESSSQWSGLSSPRQIVLSGPDEIVVSNLQSPELSFINLNSTTQLSKLDIGRSSEAMLVSGNRLFVSNWSSFYVQTDNRYVMVIDLNSKTVIDSIETGKEPESMVRDMYGKIWVLCSGGFDNSEYPVLMRFDPITLQVEEWLEFPDKDDSPTKLSISPDLSMLYFLNNGLYRMPITASSIPGQAFIPSNGNSFYALGIDPQRGDIFLSDALDYQQRGMVWRYSENGVLLQEMRAGIIPGGFCFN